ncbi:hypothetical protein SAMN05216515_11228 [Eubacterium pyruvativorans]|uniref:Uncharacterized protein n=1 Tax=Eubacterium pyruvativorans TaxID=155865 RepID=A0A1I7H283_9FIRM|nr:hypothetical protein SAMN05216515_11228 [Eubacterium pyruvativorans]SFU54780.1 hypothetical protein SAMN05216508_11128 [Eubacterium pyruvativorans]
MNNRKGETAVLKLEPVKHDLPASVGRLKEAGDSL